MTLEFLRPVYEAFAWVLAFVYGFVPNLGLSIILMTFLIMAALFPLTAKQARSMLEMQRVQPELKKLQAKYKGDRQKLNEEIMKFYQEHHINPLAGCLPLVVQMPIFVTLYEVIRKAADYVPENSELFRAFCDDATRETCNTGGLPNHLTFLGMDLSTTAIDAHASLLAAVPFFVLVGLVVLTGFFQSRQSQRNQPNMNPQMAVITKVLPVFFGVISINFPAGLVLYFLVSNSWRLGQQEYILRHYHATRAKSTIDVKGSARDTTKSSGGILGRLRAATEQVQSGNPEPAPEATSDDGAPTATPKPKRGGSRNRKRKR